MQKQNPKPKLKTNNPINKIVRVGDEVIIRRKNKFVYYGKIIK